jgi:NAD(P)-dependent dehydrogenase (short-subunit alcohol dehydrogenase family)
MRLREKVAIVSGGGYGLGRAIAQALAREGAAVVVADINLENARQVADVIRRGGGRALATGTDVTRGADVEALMQAAIGEFGRVDILVNNAGGSARERCSEFRAATPAVWDFVIDRNLKGTLSCTRAVINHMIERRGGKIVNIGSTAGMHAETGQCDYGAAKAGVIQFTKSLAREVGPYGINVNCVSPGMILGTAASEHVPRDITERGLVMQFFKRSDGRLGEPQDVANAVLFLVSEESSFITGNNISVSGGIGV